MLKNNEIPMGYLYRITNKINGKTYVGRRNLSLDKSWRQYMGSGAAVKNAIIKYGAEHFTKEFLGYYYDSKSLSEAEDDLIRSEWDKGRCEYNLSLTPDPNTMNKLSEEKRLERSRKISEASKRMNKETPEKNYFVQRGERLKLEYSLFKEDNENIILEAFRKNRNIKEVSKELSESNNWPIRWISRVIKQSGITYQKRNDFGHIVSDETKQKISLINIKNYIKNNPELFPIENSFEQNLEIYNKGFEKTCPYDKCNNIFYTKKKGQKFCSSKCAADFRNEPNILSYDELYDLHIVQGLSIRKISEKTGIGRGSIYNQLKKSNIKK